jgi:hypothetical protein
MSLLSLKQSGNMDIIIRITEAKSTWRDHKTKFSVSNAKMIPLGEAEATIASLSLTERWERLEFIFFSPPPPPRGDPFLEWLLCNFFHSKQNHYKGNQIIQTK